MNIKSVFILLATFSIGFIPSAGAETTILTVTTTEDRVDADGCRADCTLREAVLAANAAGRGTQQIQLREGTYTLSLANAAVDGEDMGATGDLDIRNNIELVRSPDADPLTPTIIEGSRALADRVIDIVAPRPTPDTTQPIRVLIQGVTIRNGSLGGIRVGPDVTFDMTDSRIENNEGFFGGLVNLGTCLLRRVTIDSNRTTHPMGGGGIINGGSLTLNEVALTRNAALNGGALMNFTSERATLNNVTVSGNKAIRFGGGITNVMGQLILRHATIYGNTADSEGNHDGHGGGLISSPTPPRGGPIPSVTISNSLIAGNTDNNPNPVETGGVSVTQSPDCGGTLTSQGHNLIQDQTGCAGLISSDLSGNPQLMPLEANGATTHTHALGAGSVAVNAGDRAFCERTDQRERPRRNGFCDIGAFEAQPAAIVVDSGGGQSARVGAAFPTPLQVRIRDASGNPLGGVDVSFTTPPSGASTVLSAARATTNNQGLAAVTATANNTTGAYTVTATIDGTTIATNLNLTNTAAESSGSTGGSTGGSSGGESSSGGTSGGGTPEVGESPEADAPAEPEAPASPTTGGGGCGCNMTSPTDQDGLSQLICIVLFAFACSLMAFRRSLLRPRKMVLILCLFLIPALSEAGGYSSGDSEVLETQAPASFAEFQEEPRVPDQAVVPSENIIFEETPAFRNEFVRVENNTFEEEPVTLATCWLSKNQRDAVQLFAKTHGFQASGGQVTPSTRLVDAYFEICQARTVCQCANARRQCGETFTFMDLSACEANE